MSNQTTMDDINHTTYPPKSTAWILVLILTFTYILSFVDRFILGLLIEPIKKDLGLSDTQIGLLLGPAFAIFYATMGVPLGWAADRLKRVWILASGIILWSFATAASGISKTFSHLFIARMSVGFGEATLNPCAFSMISDSFPPEKRGLPIAFYSAALSLGAAIASLLGAAILTWVQANENIILPILGQVTAWQLTFLILGIPGIFFGILFFFIREPMRIKTSNNLIQGRKANPLDMFKYIAKKWRVFATFLPIFCFLTITAYSQGWLAPMFQRTWGWSPRDYALINGFILLACGPLSINLAGWLSDRWYSKGHFDAPLLVAIIGALITIPSSILAPLMPSGEWCFVILAINTVGLTWLSATGITALVNIIPADIRAQIIAFYYMVISITGLMLGPTAVGLLTDNIFGEQDIRYSMVAMPIIFGIPLLLILPLSRKFYREEYKSINQN